MLENLPSSSIWELINSWFTPTVLFVFLNLVIGTIVFTSTLSNNQQQSNDSNQPKTTSVLQRLRSINFYARLNLDSESPLHFEHVTNEQKVDAKDSYLFPQVHQESFEDDLQSDVLLRTHGESPVAPKLHLDVGGDELKSMDEIYSQFSGNHFSRTKSESDPSSGVIRAELPGRIKRSASTKLCIEQFEALEMRRPATARERGNANVSDGDEEVDARADNFINMFKQHLKLQRLDSIVKYKEVVARGTAGS